MAPAVQALMCGAVGMGVPLVLAAWELFRLRRDQGGDGGRRKTPVPVTPRPLPDCLVPRLPPRPAPVSDSRVLETV